MQIDIDKIIEIQLSPTEFVVLQFLYERKYDKLESLVVSGSFDWSHTTTFKGILEHLQLGGWIKIMFKETDVCDFSKIALRDKTYKLFDIDVNNKFLKLFTIYPHKVPDGNGGVRILRTAESDSKEYKTLNKKWDEIVKGKPTLPDLIIKALEKQLELTRNKLQYTQMLSTWLNQHTWEKYVGLVDKEDKLDTTEAI